MIHRNKMIYASKKEIDTLLESIREDEMDVELMEEGEPYDTLVNEGSNQFTYLHYMMVWGICAIFIGLLIFVFVYYKIM